MTSIDRNPVERLKELQRRIIQQMSEEAKMQLAQMEYRPDTGNAHREGAAYLDADTADQVRLFATGATRDTTEGKPEYGGFLSPRVLVRFGEYMHHHRRLPDGTMRASDNWKQGIPEDVYLESMLRHVMDLWLILDGDQHLAREDMETALCAIMFNAQGLLHETLGDRV